MCSCWLVIGVCCKMVTILSHSLKRGAIRHFPCKKVMNSSISHPHTEKHLTKAGTGFILFFLDRIASASYRQSHSNLQIHCLSHPKFVCLFVDLHCFKKRIQHSAVMDSIRLVIHCCENLKELNWTFWTVWSQCFQKM